MASCSIPLPLRRRVHAAPRGQSVASSSAGARYAAHTHSSGAGAVLFRAMSGVSRAAVRRQGTLGGSVRSS